MNSYSHPKQIIDHSEMNSFQITVIGVCILLTALDGFDVLSISFASPGIADEWGISRAQLGIVLSMELIGMAVGSIVLGAVADSRGRRPTILGCLTLMTGGMFCASLVDSVNQMLLARFVTGLGIGGMLASTNAMAAEFSNAKYRNLSVILMATGYPLGVIVGGSISTVLLQHFDWRAIFLFGAAFTGFFLVISWFWLPESIEFLAGRQPRNALERINRTLKKMGHQTITQLPELSRKVKKFSFEILSSTQFRALTLLMIVAYFSHIMTFYYILKWIPKIVVDLGYEASAAGGVLVWANIGGALGAFILGMIAGFFNLRTLLIAVFICSFIMVSAFGLGYETLTGLSLIATATGFFTNAGVVGIYALLASSFPADVRASATGMVIGCGRGGAALGPIVAGYLFTAGFDLLLVSIVMGLGAVVAAMALFALGPVLRRQQAATNV